MANTFQLASLVAIVGAIFFAQWARQPVVPLAAFEEVRPSLYRLNYWWGMIPGVPPMPVATWLVESSTLVSPKSWTLIDAGTDDTANQEAILQGVKSKLATAGGSLKLILCKSVGGCDVHWHRLLKLPATVCTQQQLNSCALQ